MEALIAPLDAELVVGAVMARLRVAGESGTDARAVAATERVEPTVSSARARRGAGAAMAVIAQDSVGTPAASSAVASAGHRRASPAARKRAAGLGVDICWGERQRPRRRGPAGRPCRRQRAAREARAGGFDAAAMRRVIGAAMARSKREIPLLPRSENFNGLRAALAQAGQRKPHRRSAPVAGGAAAARGRTGAPPDPTLNGFYENGAFRAGDGIHIGWAVALRGGGLVAPAIHDVDKKSLDELMTGLRDVVMRARGGALRGIGTGRCDRRRRQVSANAAPTRCCPSSTLRRSP